MSLREHLRESTRDEHLALESLLALDRHGLTLDQYREYLRVSHAFHGALEPQLAGARELADLGLDMRLRRKSAWLDDDLAFFRLRPLRPVAALPDLVEPGRLLGCAYVLEGATLGGQVLQRALAPRWDLAPGRGGTFLAGYGARTGAMWRGFLAALEGAVGAGIDEAACVRGARETFHGFARWFRAHGWE